MADRYWVGGTAAWDGTAGTKWATTSGGAGGASVPGGSDDVYFDAASGAAVVSIGAVNSRSIICTGFTGSFTGSSQVAVYGGLTLSATMTHTNTLQYIFAATSGSWVVTTAGKSIGGITRFGNSSTTATWTLGDNFTSTAAILVNFGTFNSNNFNITASEFGSSNSNIRSINLGSSTFTLTGFTVMLDLLNITNLTFNAGTSTIIISSANALTIRTSGAGVSFYNVSFTGGGTTIIDIVGTNTFNNLSVTANTAGTKPIVFAANQTINGTLSVSGTTVANRVEFRSSVAGTQRTISLATAGTLTNTNWRDINLTGAASPWSAPLGVWNLGNNTGITFDTTPLYWVGGTGTWTDAAKWSTSSGGTGGAGVPGPTNNVFFDASSGTGTVSGTSGSPFNYCANFDCSLTSTSATFTNLFLSCYGNFKLKSGVTNGFTLIYFSGTGTHTIDPNGATNISAGGGFSILGSGTFTLMNNWVSGNAFTHSAGTFNTNGYSLSTNAFTVSETSTKILNLGTSTITITGTSGLNFSGASNLTFIAATSTISTDGAFNAGAGYTFYNVSLNGTASTPNISGANTYNNLTLVGPTSASVSAFTLNANQVVNGTFTATGSNGNQRVLVRTNNFVTQRTITAATVSITDTDFHRITGAGGGSWTGTRIGNYGSNSGITFTTPKTVYWNLVAGGGVLGSVGWATSSGGTPATVNYPLGQDTAIVENTGLNSGATLAWSTAFMAIPNLTFATRTLPVTFNVPTNIYAASNITLSSAVTRTGTQEIYFSGNTTLTSAGVTWTNAIAVYGTLTIADSVTMTGGAYSVNTGGTLTLNAPLTISTQALNFNGGTISLNSFTLTALRFTSNNTNTRVIQFGTGNITITGTGSLVNFSGTNFTYTGTPTVNISNNSATASSVLTSTGFTETNAIDLNFTTGTYSLTFSGFVRNLNFTGFAGTLLSANRTIYGNLTIPASGMTLDAGTSENTFAATSGTQTITTNGVTLDFPITQNGVGGTVQLNGSLTLGSTRTLYVQAGTFNANNNNVTAGLFRADGSNVRSVLMGSGTWTLQGTGVVWNIGATTQTFLTLNAGTSNIVLSDNTTTARTFSGGSLTYYNLTIGGTTSTSTTTFQASNTFNTLSSTKTVAHTILFTASTTNTFTNFNINGTAGNVVTIGSASASNHTLAKAGGGTVTADYLSISRSTATPTLTWLATNSTDGGNNSGWYFGAFPPPSSGNFFLLF